MNANIRLAVETKNLINAMLEADGGAKFRGWLGKVIPHMDDAYRTDESPFRSHMGASLIGGDCARAVWYGFHWATKPFFPGRVLRLFNRGHLEEARFIALLLMIGCDIYQQDENGKQYRISSSEGHFGGSGDGIAVGLPDLPPGTPALTEFKTHNDKSFKKLVEEGVRECKPEHYTQMQLYMYKMGLPVALYGAVNKNDDELHFELIELNSRHAEVYLGIADELVWSEYPPKRINESPGYYKCKWCDHRPVCHGLGDPAVNCRTCQFSRPIEGARWVCTQTGEDLSKQKQESACQSYTKRTNF
ncbi:Cas4 family CRISPR-associated exonuclease [Pseudomonas phage MiCath]|uniref:Cas4 family CRISPR-associated exonuclease n=1 Tax=Pseudomonas phage MiCath TaxID=3003729 RepID=A0AAE9VE03_9CAUD|nr:Cas4 family CRISPR-associated exonuclease [Pseudomonas phage MiCath]WAX22445.1 Cas4 family CRISPR-associated exonuclease [Pseudomonas phage MiCath]